MGKNKNKRLIAALIIIVALTLPRFLLITVEEEERAYFDDNEMPDGPGDMKDWQAQRVSVCDKCLVEIKELVDKDIPPKSSGMSLYYYKDASRVRVDRRCPVHEDVTLNSVHDFFWDRNPEAKAKSEKPVVPEILDPLYLRVNQMDAAKWWRSLFICRECQKVLTERLGALMADEDASEELNALVPKLIRGEPVEGLPNKLYYTPDDITRYYCAFHKGQKFRDTVRIPPSPVTVKSLPDDTGLISRLYVRENPRQRINLMIVTAGRDKRSIHRPERCLTSQGYHLAHRTTINIKIPGSKRKSMAVKKLRMVKTQEGPESGQMRTERMIVFYWYASVEHITESNLARLMYTAWDRMVLGKNYRWSYLLLYSNAWPDLSKIGQITDKARKEEAIKEAEQSAEREVVEGLYTFMQQFFPHVEKAEKRRREEREKKEKAEKKQKGGAEISKKTLDVRDTL